MMSFMDSTPMLIEGLDTVAQASSLGSAGHNWQGLATTGNTFPGEGGWTMSMVEDVRARRTGSGDEVFIMAVSAKDKESFPSSLELTIPNSANAVELSDIELDSLILGQEQFQAVGGTSQALPELTLEDVVALDSTNMAITACDAEEDTLSPDTAAGHNLQQHLVTPCNSDQPTHLATTAGHNWQKQQLVTPGNPGPESPEVVLYQEGDVLSVVTPPMVMVPSAEGQSVLLPYSVAKRRRRPAKGSRVRGPSRAPVLPEPHSSYVCEACGFTGERKAVVARHVREVHEGGARSGRGAARGF